MSLSDIHKLGDKLRIDSKYFSKSAVAARHLIEAKPSDRLEDITAVMRKGIFDIKADTYTEPGHGVPFIRIGDLRNGMINDGTTAWISEDAHKAEFKTVLKRGDIAISKTAYPDVALITLEECNVSQDMIATKLSNEGSRSFTSEYIVSFLFSSIGMALMEAEFQGNVQEHLGLADARRLSVPRLDYRFQERIKDVFQLAYSKLVASSALIESAENELVRSLGLSPELHAEPLTYHRSSSFVTAAARLDAEFFAPRIRGQIERLGRSGLSLSDVAPARHEKFAPTAPGSFEYIEIGDVGSDGRAESRTLDRADAPSRATWHVHTGDVITSTVRPIRRLSALIEAHQDGHVCSSGFVVLQPTTVRPEVLLTYLRLPIFCELMDLHTSASMYPAISEKDLIGLPFAPPDPATETAVCAAVTDAQHARSQAAVLLNAAKRAVEIAIEEDEPTALRFLDDEEG